MTGSIFQYRLVCGDDVFYCYVNDNYHNLQIYRPGVEYPIIRAGNMLYVAIDAYFNQKIDIPLQEYVDKLGFNNNLNGPNSTTF
jgi:hypothetical protein